MAIIQGCTNFKVYKGTRKPQAIKYGSKHVKGWGIDSTTTFPKTFTTTYNDTADVVVKGKSLQKSEWVHKQGQSSQENPLKNQLPEDNRKFEGWTKYQGSAVTLTQGISVEEWNTTEATRIQTSG
ncbi:MAG TPA: hypothetical protein PLR95_07660, partial [Paludibacteraceae bacterium]|nr:hypothetical protein [Paludibacteraceae bacterium]